jgi:hypothetical protein
MSYSTEGFEKCTSSQIQENIDRREHTLKLTLENHGSVETIQAMNQQLDSIRADLILKKQEEKAEMKQLLSRLLEMVGLM